jgi:tetratricopeptide (TPR) repeat protein
LQSSERSLLYDVHVRVRPSLLVVALAAAFAVSVHARADEPSWATSQAAELTRQARAYAASGDGSAAARRYLEAIRFDPTYGPPYLGLAALHEASGDIAEAERVYATGMERVLGFAEGYAARARMRLRLRRLREAAQDMEAALALSPGDVALWKELCGLYVSQGALPAALGASRRIEALAEAEGDAAALAEARTRSKALAMLIGEVDPVTAGARERGPVRRAIAMQARRKR